MKTLSLLAFTMSLCPVMAGAGYAMGFKGGEVGIGYAINDSNDLPDDVTELNLGGVADFSVTETFGVQVGVGYTDLGYNDGSIDIGVDLTTFDIHAYFEATGGFKFGGAIGLVQVGDLTVGGLGSVDLDTDIMTYALEGMADVNGSTFYGAIGIADVDDIPELDIRFISVGYDFAVSDALEVFGKVGNTKFQIDGVSEDLDITTAEIGLNYYLDPVSNVPMKLNLSIGRSRLDVDGFDADVTRVGIGASFLFGGTDNTSRRERLFDSYNNPL